MARIHIEFPEKEEFTTEVTIRVTDLNYGGHLGNEMVLAYAQQARVAYLQSLGHADEKHVAGAGLIMVNALVNYKAEGLLGMQLNISVSPMRISGSSFDLVYRMTDKKTAKTIAEVQTGMVCFDYEQNRPLRIPENLRAQMTPSGH